MTKLLTVDEVGQILGIKPPRVYSLTREGLLPHINIGARQYRYSEQKILNWLESGGNQKGNKLPIDSTQKSLRKSET